MSDLNNLPILPEKVSEALSPLPDVLARNVASVDNATKAMTAMMDTIEANGGINSPEMDQSVNDLLVKVRATRDKMNERRAPITQFMTSVAKLFTTQEAALDPKGDTLPAKLQAERVKYADLQLKRKQEEERRIAQETAEKKERAEMLPKIKGEIERDFIDTIAKAKAHLSSIFSGITLENGDQVQKALTDFPVVISPDALNQIYAKIQIPLIFMSKDEFSGMVKETLKLMRADLESRYSHEVSECRRELYIEIPARLQELQEIAEAGEAEKARLEKEAEERRQRVEREAERQRLQALEDTKRKEEMSKAQATTATLFDQQIEVAAVQPETKFQEVTEITVLSAQGYLPLIALYFEKEGAGEKDLEKLGKKTLDSMRKYCEGLADKHGIRTESPLVQYKKVPKVQTRK